MDSDKKSSEVHARKSLDCCEWTLQGNSGESLGEKESCRESLHLLMECLRGCDQNIVRNMDCKDNSNEVSEMRNMLLETTGNMIIVIKWQITKLCLGPHILWKVELMSNEIGYLAQEISKQSVKDAGWLLLSAYSKM